MQGRRRGAWVGLTLLGAMAMQGFTIDSIVHAKVDTNAEWQRSAAELGPSNKNEQSNVPKKEVPEGPYVVKNWRAGLALTGYTNAAFRMLRVSKEEQNPTMIRISGEAKVVAGIFHARIKDSSGRIMERQTKAVAQGSPAWSSFAMGFSVPPSLKGHVCILELFEENPKDGSDMNRLSIHILY